MIKNNNNRNGFNHVVVVGQLSKPILSIHKSCFKNNNLRTNFCHFERSIDCEASKRSREIYGVIIELMNLVRISEVLLRGNRSA